MPYLFDTNKVKLKRSQDRRVKLTLSEREEIARLYGSISQRKLAKMFNVSRSTIIFIGDPEKHRQNLLRRAERGGSMRYYDKEQQRQAVQRLRLYKKELIKKGELDNVRKET